MLSDEECKKILSRSGNLYTNEEVEIIKETLYKLIEIIEVKK